MKSSLLALAFSLLGAAHASAQCPGNDLNGNTSIVNATQLYAGYNLERDYSVVETVTNINPFIATEAQDLFAFSLANGRTAQFSLDFDSAQSPMTMQVISINGGTIQQPDSGTQGSQLTFTNLTGVDRDYYLLIFRNTSAPGCADYDLAALIEGCPADDLYYEDNDTCLTATQLVGPQELNPQTALMVSVQMDDDWFEFDIAPGSTLSLEIEFVHDRADLDMSFYNTTGGNCGGSTIGVSQSTDDQEELSYTNTTTTTQTIAARVYFYQSTAGNSCNDYRFYYSVDARPDDSYEPNDGLCSPAQSSATDSVGILSDLYVYDDNTDHYEFTVYVDETIDLSIDFSNANGDLDMRLYDLTGGCFSTQLITSSESTSDREVIRFSHQELVPVTVVLEVYYYPSDGGGNEYSLTTLRTIDGDVGGMVCFGVPNSTGIGGALDGLGSTSISSNDLTLDASRLPLNVFGFYSTSMGFGFGANPGGSTGNICITGAPIGRYSGPGQILNSGATGHATFNINWNSMPVSGVPSAAPGETWYFQFWHRDVVAGAATSNFTAALAVRTTL